MKKVQAVKIVNVMIYPFSSSPPLCFDSVYRFVFCLRSPSISFVDFQLKFAVLTMGNASCSEPVICTNVPLCGPEVDCSTVHQHLDYSAGAAFEDTVKNLPYFERQLLLFCGTGNLSAVRWLLHLGANKHTKDQNAGPHEGSLLRMCHAGQEQCNGAALQGRAPR